MLPPSSIEYSPPLRRIAFIVSIFCMGMIPLHLILTSMNDNTPWQIFYCAIAICVFGGLFFISMLVVKQEISHNDLDKILFEAFVPYSAVNGIALMLSCVEGCLAGDSSVQKLMYIEYFVTTSVWLLALLGFTGTGMYHLLKWMYVSFHELFINPFLSTRAYSAVSTSELNDLTT
jgi:hypothetical protein